MGKCLGRGHPAAGGAVEQAGGEQERLVDVLDGVGLFGDRHRKGVEADRAAGKLTEEDYQRLDRELRAEAIDILKRIDRLRPPEKS